MHSDAHRALVFISNREGPRIHTLTEMSVCAHLWLYSVLTPTLHWRCSQTLHVSGNVPIPSLFFNVNSVVSTFPPEDLELLLLCPDAGGDLRSVTAACGYWFRCCNAVGTQGANYH